MNPDVPEDGDDLFICPVCDRQAWGNFAQALEVSEQPFVCPGCGGTNRGSWKRAISSQNEAFRKLEKEKDAKILRLEQTNGMLAAFLFFAVCTIAVMKGC